MKNEMDNDRLFLYRSSILELGDRYSNLYNRINNLADSGCGARAGKNEISELLLSIAQTKGKLVQVSDAIRVLVEASAEEETRASGSISDTSVQEKKYGYAEGILAGTTDINDTPYGYMGYESYCLAKEENFRFSAYDDVTDYTFEFLNSGFASMLAGKELSNFALMVTVATGNTQAYTDLIAQESLRSTLDSMDDVVTTVPELPSDMKNVFDVLFGLGDNWKDAWDQIYNTRGRKRYELNEEEGNPKVILLRELIDGIPNNRAKQLNAFFSVFKDAGELAKKGEKGWSIIMRLFADYSAQLDYLDTIEKSFTRNGYISESMKKDIDALRSQYNSIVCDYLSKKATEEIKALEGVAVTRLCKEFPGLGVAVGALNMTSIVIGDKYKTQISAAYSLYGSVQYEKALTDNYNRYVDLIQKNLATEQEIKEAESLYQVIKATKISEYRNMITLEEWKIQEGQGSEEILEHLKKRLNCLEKLELRAEEIKTKAAQVSEPKSSLTVNGC